MLELRCVDVFYGGVQALKEVTLEVPEHGIVALIGSNGAGKTTTLKAISGLIQPARGEISFLGDRLDNKRPEQVVAMGIVHVPEGRRVFPGLTVLENLEIGASGRRRSRSLQKEVRDDIERVLELFPALRQRASKYAWSLSGGEQQMLALGRGLMARPKMLLLDEPSLGLAPVLVEQVFETIEKINKTEGTGILLVEQNAYMALSISAKAYVIESGSIVLEGSGIALLEDDRVKKAYLAG